MSSKLVVVPGATGQQGGAVARRLLARGHKVRALVRNLASAGAEALKRAGAETVQGTMENRDGLNLTVRGADAVFAVTTPFEAGMDAEVRQGKNVADAVNGTGVHLVFTSVAWAGAKTGIPHFESKWIIEEHIRARGVPHTIIGPCYFMENAIAPWSIDSLRQGTIAVPLSDTVKLPMIAIDNIAALAVLAIEQPERMKGRRVDIAGDVLTGPETAEVLSRATGRAIRYSAVPLESVRAQSEDLYIMFEYFEKNQPTLDVASIKRDYPEIAWKTCEQWAAAQPWPALLGGSATA